MVWILRKAKKRLWEAQFMTGFWVSPRKARGGCEIKRLLGSSPRMDERLHRPPLEVIGEAQIGDVFAPTTLAAATRKPLIATIEGE